MPPATPALAAIPAPTPSPTPYPALGTAQKPQNDIFEQVAAKIAAGTYQPKPRDLNKYEVLDELIGAPYAGIGDAAYARDKYKELTGDDVELVTEIDERTREPYYYLIPPDPERKNMEVQSVKYADGKKTVEYAPKPDLSVELNRINTGKEMLGTMEKQIQAIQNLADKGILPDVGKLGSYVQYLPFDTDANDIRILVKNVQGNVAFEQLMKMKAESKTGSSGLGALSDKELGLLASLQGSIDPDMRSDQFTTNLSDILRKTQEQKKILEEEEIKMRKEYETGEKQTQMTPIKNYPVVTNQEEYLKIPAGPFYWKNPTTGELELRQKPK
jgi:hypothetical protein